MDTIEGTDIGQANLTQAGQNSVGSAFAEMNPPMSAKALAIAVAEVPRPWHPSAEQKVVTVTTFSNSALMAELTGDANPVEPWQDKPVCGVVTVNNENWMPKNFRAVPPSITNKLGMYLSAQWAIFYNGSSEARRRHHWALVTTRGTVIILTGIGLKKRPINPSDFPPCVIDGLTTAAADDIMKAANAPRCEFARVPREWTVAVRRADSVDPEGGDA